MNSLDLMIIFSAIVSFLIFLAVHVEVFRHINHADVAKWFGIILISVGVPLLVIVGMILDMKLAALIAFVLYSFMACAYFMGIFGLLATSLRIRLLTEIAQKGNQGVTRDQILTHYNRESIVKNRLDRFVRSHDIIQKGNMYQTHGGLTFFVLPALVLKLMEALYGKNT